MEFPSGIYGGIVVYWVRNHMQASGATQTDPAYRKGRSMDFTHMFGQMAVLFFCIVVGYLANRCRLMDGELNRRLSALVLNVTTPAMILASVMTGEELPGWGEVGSILAVSLVSYGLAFLLAAVVPKLLRAPAEQAGAYRFMTVFGNVGFIGFPVVAAVFGDSAVFYASIFNLPFNLLVYTVGVLFLSGGKEAVKLDWKLLVSPCVLASLATLVIALGHIRFPALVGQAVDLLGQVTTPAALLIIGSSLAQLPIRTVAGTPRVWALAVLRLIVMPLLVFFLLRPFVHNQLILGIAMVVAGMPVASNCTILCLQYGGDQELASQGTFVTTLCSMVTIPLLASVLL